MCLFSIIVILGSIGSLNIVEGTGTFHLNRRSTAALFEPENFVPEERYILGERIGDEEEKEKEEDEIHFENKTSGIIWAFVILGAMYGILILGTCIMCVALKREEKAIKRRDTIKGEMMAEEYQEDNVTQEDIRHISAAHIDS